MKNSRSKVLHQIFCGLSDWKQRKRLHEDSLLGLLPLSISIILRVSKYKLSLHMCLVYNSQQIPVKEFVF